MTDNTNQPAFGNQTIFSNKSDYNSLVFLFNQLLLQKHTMTLVQVKSFDESKLSVNVQPLVTMIDGSGNSVPYGILYSLPVMRLQGGNSGIICNPKKNDIGLAIFADRDITKVVNTKSESAPDSFRVMSMSDGVYLSGLLNSEPTQYIKFFAGGIDIMTALTNVLGNLSVSSGATGSFNTPTGSIVSVVNGIVTNIT